MKKWILLLMMILLTGCGAEDTFETVSDELILPVMAQPGYISVELPGETALPVIGNDRGRVYICNDYEIVIQTLEAGDLEQTLRELSGHTKADLTVMETARDGVTRYEFVWAAAGEGGDKTGRAVILDDGAYHYCMSVLRADRPEGKSQVCWEDVFQSFRLA